MEFEIFRSVVDQILAEAAAAHPRECCGILLGDSETVGALRPARNVHPAPETHFEIDPRALVDAHRAARGEGPHVMGYYHSHPRGPAEPSATDQAMAARDGRVSAIAGEGEVRFWRDGERGFERLSLRVIDR